MINKSVLCTVELSNNWDDNQAIRYYGQAANEMKGESFHLVSILYIYIYIYIEKSKGWSETGEIL